MATIVIVDDNTDSCQFMQRLLQFEGHMAVPAAGGPALVATLMNMKPDLLLLDVMMPGTSGIDLLRQVRGEPSLQSLPVVMVSGVMDLNVQAEAFAAGASDYIVKDMDWEKSLQRIQRHLKGN